MALDDQPTHPLPGRRGFLRPLIASALVLVLLAGGGTAAFIVSQSAGSDAPPQPNAFSPPASTYRIALFDVREANGDKITLIPANTEGDAFTISLPVGVAIEAMVTASPSTIVPGDWLTILGNSDPVRNFVIRHVIIVPMAGAPSADGLVRSPAGFIGNEIISDISQRPVLWGRVEAVSPGNDDGTALVTLTGPNGPITVQLFNGAVLSRIEPHVNAIAGGDRIASRAEAGTSPEGAQAVLVNPQGAR